MEGERLGLREWMNVRQVVSFLRLGATVEEQRVLSALPRTTMTAAERNWISFSLQMMKGAEYRYKDVGAQTCGVEMRDFEAQ